jgi:hypothetical protein
MRPRRHHDGHHALADPQVGRHVLADLVEHPGHVHARHVRRRDVLQLLGAGPAADQGVGRVDRRRADPDPHLARAGLRLGKLHDMQGLGPAELGDSYRSHVR